MYDPDDGEAEIVVVTDNLDDINNINGIETGNSEIDVRGDNVSADVTLTVNRNETDGNTTRDLTASEIDPDIPILIHGLSIEPCRLDESYGPESPTSMYVDKGCSGVFTYKGRVGTCSNTDEFNGDKKKVCFIDKYEIGRGGKVLGLHNPNLVLINDLSENENCQLPGSYGINDHNTMFTSKGCQGEFRYGSMFGYCRDTGHDGTTTKTFCPIGKVERMNGSYQGLRTRSIDFYRDEVSGNCRGDEVMHDLKFRDKNMLEISGLCDAKYKWGSYLGRCKSFRTEEPTACPIDDIWHFDGTNLGLVPE